MGKNNSLFTRISIYTIVSIMVALFCTVCVRVFTRLILIERFSMDNKFTQMVMFDNEALKKNTSNKVAIDWAGLYPFEEEKTEDTESERINLASEIINSFKNLQNSLSTYSKDHLVFYTKFTECAKAYNNFMDWTVEKYNEETILTYDDGHLVGTMWKIDVSEHIENICDFNDFLKDNDLPFLYVTLPGKISKEDKGIYGVIDFSNQNVDEILKGVKKEGVDVFDIREKMSAEFESHHKQFFITDHHWKPETGLWAAGKLAMYLNENYGHNFELKKVYRENFTKETYEKIFLGTYGRNITLSVADPESIDLFYPKYDVDVSIEIPVRDLSERGDFSTYYYYKMLEPGDFYNTAPYVSYMYGDDAITRLINNNCDNEKSILVIGDSMDNVMLPFLSLGVKQITAMDLRVFNGSLKTYIKQHKDEYDMVLLTNCVFSTTVSQLFDFS